MAAPPPADSSGSFYEFQCLVVKVANEGSHTGKTEIIKQYLHSFGGDVYLFFKLFLCKEDKRVYNLRDKSLVKVLSAVFQCSHAEMKEHLSEGDVSETAKKFFKVNGRPQKWSNYTLKQIDAWLEKFTTVSKHDDQAHVMRQFVKMATADDLRFFVRIMDKDIKAVCGPRYALAALHVDAFQAYKNSSNLKTIVDRCLGKSASSGDALKDMLAQAPTNAPAPAKKGGIKTGMTLMAPIKPMLAKACKSIDEAMTRCPKGMFAEIKYDGERLQIHKDGDTFAYFSRNLKTVLPWKVVEVEKFIPMSTSAPQIVMDAEILLIDNKTGTPLPFGTLNVHKKTLFKTGSVCIFVFDILYLNGEDLLNKPITERRALMEKHVKEVPNRVMLSEMKHIVEADDLTDMMDRVLREGLEGLVLKPVETTYRPAARHWLKIKKDYLAGMADSADLVVLGGWYGSGRKGGLITTFLMGLYEPNSQTWRTVCKCGSGFDDAGIAKLQKDVVPLMQPCGDFDKVPTWLKLHRHHTPDYVMIDAKTAPVWEIMGSEFSNSNHHTANGISIRFPRLFRVRDDKDWTTATSLPELEALKAASAAGTTLKGAKGKKAPKKAVPVAPKRTPAPAAVLQAPVVGKRKRDADNAGPPAKQPRTEEIKTAPCGQVTLVKGDVTKPFSTKPNDNRIILHCADDSGCWGRGGIFKAISKISKEPQRCYRQAKLDGKNCSLGDAQLVQIPCDTGKGDLYVCIAVCMAVQAGPPKFSLDAFKKCLSAIVPMASSRSASIHMPRIVDSAVPGMRTTEVMSAVQQHLGGANLAILIYSLRALKGGESVMQVPTTTAAPPAPTTNSTGAGAGAGAGAVPASTGPATVASTGPAGTTPASAIPAGGEQYPLVGVCVVFSGIVEPELTDLGSKLVALGGNIQDKWISGGVQPSTHLMCTSEDVPLYEDVANSGGLIVRPAWLRRCFQLRMRVSEAMFGVDGGSFVDANTSQDVADALDATESSDDDVREHLPDIFSGVTVYMYGQVEDSETAFRYIVAFAGDVEDEYYGGSSITHVVTAQPWDSTLENIVRQHPSIRIVHPEWIWNSVQKRSRVHEKPYYVKRGGR